MIGFAGLVLFMNPGLVDWGDWRVLAGNAMLLLSAICWARSGFWPQTFWQLAVSTILALIAAIPELISTPIHWTPALTASLLYNWAVTMPLGYFLWNKVLSILPATVAGQVMALTPILGFALSVAVFGGAISWDVILSIGLIVLGIIITLRA